MEAFLSRVSVNYKIPLGEITELHNLYKAKKGDLVQLCKERKLPHSGSKQELLDRLNIIGAPPVKSKKKSKSKPEKKTKAKKETKAKAKPKKETKTKPEKKTKSKAEKKTKAKPEKKTKAKKKPKAEKKVKSDTQEFVKNQLKYTEVKTGKTVKFVTEDNYVLDKETKLVVGKLKGTKVFKLKQPDIELLLSRNINYDPKRVVKGAAVKQAEEKLNVLSD